jgi:acyl-CoA thioesterase-1
MRDRFRVWRAAAAIATWTACSATATDKTKASPDSAASISGGHGAAVSGSKSIPTNTPETAARAGKPVVLFVGTSLTAGLGLEPDSAYPMLIQQRIDSAGLGFEVVNAGVSGETSSGLLDRLDWLTRARFDVLVLETGANDGLRGIPTATLKANIQTALDRLKSTRPGAKVVLVQMEALPNLGPRYASDFHALYGDVAKEKGVALLPFLLTDVAGKRELNQADGVHPNNRGERIVADNVWKGLRPILVGAAAR